ncbi:glycosyltransferase family 2 protein [Magnetococcus sp. PR-3]|uniref:glycosyltransferase family 2 protein n=1 Tax=Magnetococcus sp. PR-3 TaxID=3120355 RepID=UPI002FCE1AC4
MTDNSLFTRPADEPKISVIIPVKNEGHNLKACLEGILTQDHAVLEIIVVDSGSQDETCTIAQSYPKVKLVEIDPSTFNHGDTRNLAVSHCQGEMILATVGDARASNHQWISRLLEGMENPDTWGVCGLQVVPHEQDKNPVDWYRPVSTPTSSHYHYENEEAFERADLTEKRSATGWDDVTALYRAEALKQLPFPKTPYSEDMLWAAQALRMGKRLVYNPAAQVYHYHTYDAHTVWRVTLISIYMRYLVIGVEPSDYSTFHVFLQTVKLLLRTPGLSIKQRLYWLRYNWMLIQARRDCIQICQKTIQQGNKAFSALFNRHCATPPIPLKPKNKTTP